MEKKELDKMEVVELGYRGYFILVSIILACAVGIIALLMNHLKTDNLEIRELKEKIKEEEKACPNNSVPVYLTKEDLVSTLFSNKLSKEETLSDYHIDGVVIEDTNKFIGSGTYANRFENVDTNSIFAVVTYSVKPTGAIGKSIWNNNGTYEDEWVKGRQAYIHIRKTNNGYVIDGQGYGTKW